MISSGIFWMVLAGAVAIFWLLAARWRMPFLALTSAGYIIWYEFDAWRGEGWVYRLGGLWLLAFCILFYNLAPLAKRRRSLGDGPSPRPSPGGGGSEPSSRRSPGVAGEGESATAVLVEAPPVSHTSKRWILPALILGIIAYLILFKYIIVRLPAHRPGQRESGLLLPLGISYFTFKFIHYAIETARGAIRERSPWQFLCWVYLFPTFSMGPIERFDHFTANQQKRLGADDVAYGLTRIICGLIKRFVIAGMLLAGWYAAASNPQLLRRGLEPTTTRLWGLAVVSYIYLYMDFSGYCDIAIGAARLFGIRIMENFQWPIFSQNIGTFWKRWHMTLAGWCQSYIYMPMLGLTRSTVVALFSTFIVIGLWHQGSIPWLSWGLYNALGIYVYQLWARVKRKRKWSALDRAPWNFGGIALTFLFVAAGEVLTFACVSSGPNIATRAHDMLRLMAKLVFIQIPA